jgi:shikimate dehydrogenase
MRRFGLIGYPLSHSFSRKYFKNKFLEENIIDSSYQLLPIQDINELPSILMQLPELEGFNVTIPHKINVIPFLNEVDETATAAGAVNTVKVTREDDNVKLKGYNTDVYGFEMSLKPLLQPNHYKALILGSGGASKAVEYVFKKLGITYMVVSRIKDTNNPISVTYTDLNEYAIKNFPLIVNTTPLGMFPEVDTCPDIPYQYLTEDNFLYDLVYNPDETQFMAYGKEKGSITQNGLSMLKLQAEKAWQIWNS